MNKALLREIATSLPFRGLVAFFILYMHLHAIAALGEQRFGKPWQNPLSLGVPRYLNSDTDMRPIDWDRLVVARWDAQHYIEIALRGYQKCKTPEELKTDEFPDDDKRCQLNFFPTYGLIGRYVASYLGWAIDYSLLLVSLIATFFTVMIWTSRVITKPLGVGMAYLSLLLLNVFTTGFVLVTIQTEPLFLALTLGTFYCFARRWLWAAALLAGAASSTRVTGIATSVAYCLALLVITIPERRVSTWIVRVFYMLLSGWGLALLGAYFHYRFDDAFIYLHAHGRQYHHEASIAPIIHPDTRLLMQSIWSEPHDGVWLAAGLLWFALGHRRGLEKFDVASQAFFYALFICVVGVSMVGSSEYAYGGLSRYLLCVPPLFFAMAGILKRRPIVLAIWLYISVAHYWGGNMCFYVSHEAPDRFAKCGFARSTVE